MRECNQCGVKWSPSGFYKSRPRRCKECVKARARENRRRRIEYYRQYDRERSREPERQEHITRVVKRMRRNHPEKYKAHTAVNNAVRDGRLQRRPCERCGTTDNVHAHHDDYSRPLDVTWLCAVHHKERHAELDALMESA